MSKRHVDHIGVVVDDLDAAARLLERMLGSPPTMRKELADVGLRIAEFAADNVAIELIQHTGDGDGFAATVLGRRAGINHIAFRVDDVEAAVADLDAGGVRTMDGFPRPGAHGRVAFLDPATTEGLLLEVCAPG